MCRDLTKTRKGMIWQYLSGSFNKRSVESDIDYKALIIEAQQQEKSIFANDIEKDLNRYEQSLCFPMTFISHLN